MKFDVPDRDLTIEVNGEIIPVTVRSGRYHTVLFIAPDEADAPSSSSLDGLISLVSAARTEKEAEKAKAKARKEFQPIRATHVSGRSIFVRGVHSGNGDLLITWGDSGERDRCNSGQVLRALDDSEMVEYRRLSQEMVTTKEALSSVKGTSRFNVLSDDVTITATVEDDGTFVAVYDGTTYRARDLNSLGEKIRVEEVRTKYPWTVQGGEIKRSVTADGAISTAYLFPTAKDAEVALIAKNKEDAAHDALVEFVDAHRFDVSQIPAGV